MYLVFCVFDTAQLLIAFFFLLVVVGSNVLLCSPPSSKVLLFFLPPFGEKVDGGCTAWLRLARRSVPFHKAFGMPELDVERTHWRSLLHTPSI